SLGRPHRIDCLLASVPVSPPQPARASAATAATTSFFILFAPSTSKPRKNSAAEASHPGGRRVRTDVEWTPGAALVSVIVLLIVVVFLLAWAGVTRMSDGWMRKPRRRNFAERLWPFRPATVADEAQRWLNRQR